MSFPTLDKGKGKALPEDLATEDDSHSYSHSHAAPHASSSSSSSSSASDSDSTGSDSSSESDSESESESESDDNDLKDSDLEDAVTPEYLASLLERARQNAAASARQNEGSGSSSGAVDDGIIQLDDPQSDQQKLPPLDPGVLPKSYFTLSATHQEVSSLTHDLDAERAERSTASLNAPAPPVQPDPDPLTKKEKKALKAKTAGADWYDLPAPAEADLPRLYREVEAMRLRNQLDPKRFYKRDEGEGKGIKGLPKYFAIGTVVPTSTPFGKASGDNLVRAARKRTLVDELVDDAEARRYAKKKFGELQAVRGAKGRGTLAARKAAKKTKW